VKSVLIRHCFAVQEGWSRVPTKLKVDWLVVDRDRGRDQAGRVYTYTCAHTLTQSLTTPLITATSCVRAGV
jgi:hypothetical protein